MATRVLPLPITDIATRLRATPLAQITVDDVWDFFSAAGAEAQAADLSDAQHAKLFDYKRGLGTMLSRPAYYRQVYCRPFRDALRAIGRRFPSPKVLDVCCGNGGQSIALALAGAHVTGIDRDEAQVDLARRRSALWEQAGGGRLELEFHQRDILKTDFGPDDTFDVIYSHSGIGTFLSASDLFARFSGRLRRGGLLILRNGNPDCWWLRAVGRKASDSSRRDYVTHAQQAGLRPLVARGTTAIPRPLWLLGEALRWPDALLRPIVPLQLHLQYVFEKS
jgi:SAM-dependent methyltransferase